MGLGQHDVGETFHSPCGQGVAQHAGEGDGDVVAGEGGVPLDERCGDMGAEVVDGGHLLDELSGAGIVDPDDDRFGAGGGDRDAAAAAPRPPPATIVGGADGAGEQLVDVVGAVADGGGFGVPAGIEGLAVELVLAGPGRQRGRGGRRRTGLAEPFELVVDLVATLREQGQHPLGDAGDLAVTAAVEHPVDAQSGGELVADGGVVDGARRRAGTGRSPGRRALTSGRRGRG